MLLVSVFALSADPLSRYLPDSSLVSLRAGAVSSVSLPSEGMLSLAPTVSSRDALAAEIRDLRPTVGVEVLQVLAGITGRYVNLDHMTCGEVDLAAGAVVPAHQHPHEQVTYVLSGQL